MPPRDAQENSKDTWINHAVREIQAGRDEDHVYFGQIFKHYEPRCIRLLKSLGLRRDLDDLVQVVMWRIYRGISEFRLESSFDTWFISIVKNTARNARRDRNTKKMNAAVTSLDALLELEGGSERLVPDPEDQKPDPLEIAMDAEREVQLGSLLQELPPRMRQAMLLYYLHGFKQLEIAELQGTSVNTVKKQLVEGRKRIRPLFDAASSLFGLPGSSADARQREAFGRQERLSSRHEDALLEERRGG